MCAALRPFCPLEFPPPLDFPAVSAIYALLDEKSVPIFAVASGSADLSTPKREPMHVKFGASCHEKMHQLRFYTERTGQNFKQFLNSFCF